MTRRNYSNFKWDLLLNGEKHLVDLDDIGWDGGIADFRATVHYQADKRRGTAKTRKFGPGIVEVQAFGCRSLEELQAAARQRHAEEIKARREEFSTQFIQLNPTSADNTPTPESEPTEADIEALLGPCTCGQAPNCQPSCARAGG